MKLVGAAILNRFTSLYPDTKSQIDSWVLEVKSAARRTPHELKQRYPKASILKNGWVVFNIRGNLYRLGVKIAYKTGIVSVEKAGTHKEYDKWKFE